MTKRYYEKPSQLPLTPHGRTSAQNADGGKEKVPDEDASKKKGSRSKPKKKDSKSKPKKKESQIFEFIAGTTVFPIPIGTKLLTITALGASGGGFDASPTILPGGVGGYLKASFDVSPAESASTGLKAKEELTIIVGGEGSSLDTLIKDGRSGGFNGGGSGSTLNGGKGAGGGGSSSVKRNNIDKIEVEEMKYLIVAGGGGGAATPSSIGGAGAGGAGDRLEGGTDVKFGREDGRGGTQTAGGAGGQGIFLAGEGFGPKVGGAGGNAAIGTGGGGGGGGYCGGGEVVLVMFLVVQAVQVAVDLLLLVTSALENLSIFQMRLLAMAR